MRQQLFNSKKTERIIIAAFFESEVAVSNHDNTRCIIMISLIVLVLADDVIDSFDSQVGE